MQRSVDGPKAVWSSAQAAADWLGLTEKGFLAEAKLFPHLLPFTAIGKAHKWHWMDLVVYAHVRQRLAKESPEEEEEDEK